MLSDPEAAGAGRDWLEGAAPGIAWLVHATDRDDEDRKRPAPQAQQALGQTVSLRVSTPTP